MAAQPQVFTNAAKATALANAIAGSAFPSSASWFVREQWNGGESGGSGLGPNLAGAPGERWKTAFDGARIDLVYVPASALWQATLYPGS